MLNLKDKTLIFDMGGVLMDHNIPDCIKRFKEILGENYHRLGLGGNIVTMVMSGQALYFVSCRNNSKQFFP